MNFLKKLKFPAIYPVLLLSSLSLITLASLSSNDNAPFLIFKKQIIWLIIGIILFFLISQYFDYRSFYRNNLLSVCLYVFSLILLIFVLILGAKTRGIAGWINFQFFNFQPVELAKLSLIVILSRYFALWHFEIWRPFRFLISALYTAIFFILVFLQPDLGSAFILVIIWLGILIIAGLKPKYFILLIILGIAFSIIGWNYILEPYQQQRIATFFNPEKDPLGAGYNVIQSKIAIGSGSWFGLGLGQGIETQLKFLPEAKTDFFLAGFVEEWGFIGALILCFSFVWLIVHIANIGIKTKDNFAKFFIFGYLIVLISHIVINFGANLGFLPITGLPLPFLSYGGSNLIMNFVFLGIIRNIKLKGL